MIGLPETADATEKGYLRTSIGQQELVETLVKVYADDLCSTEPAFLFGETRFQQDTAHVSVNKAVPSETSM